MAAITLRSLYPQATRRLSKPVSLAGRIGDHTLFYGKALAGVPFAAAHYRREVIRLIAEISMGAGTLAMIGGTVVIVGFFGGGIENDRIEPLADRHAGAARGLARAVTRIRMHSLEVPRSAGFHATTRIRNPTRGSKKQPP